jgi:Na+-translocating ferredoxin:NAD+ oxidoreductase RnfG subunit
MSSGPWNPHHKYAPGLGDKINGQIASILAQWRKAGIGQMKERKHGRG